MHRFARFLIVGVCAVGFVPAASDAGTWRVGRAATDCPGGCNFHDGSIGAELGGGIQRAMANLSVFPGDTVLVYPRPGNGPDVACDLNNRFTILTYIKSGVVLKSANGPGTVCFAGAANSEAGLSFINTSEATVVDGMKFQWNAFSAGFGGGVSCFVASGVIKNCIFDGCVAGVGSAIYQFLSDVRVENNLIINNVSGIGGGAVALSSSNPTIQNNTFFRNSAPFGIYGASLYSSDSSPTITRNVVVESIGATAVYCAGSGPATITCNLFWNNPVGVFGGSCGDLTGIQNNVNANPGFCDSANDDFNVCVYSPALTGPCGNLGYTPPTGGVCSSCPTAAPALESATWGRIKSIYR